MIADDPASVVVFDVPARLARYRSAVSYRGRSGGVSVPVAHGVRYRTGGFSGRRISSQRLVVEDEGRLIQTLTTLTFMGSRKTVKVPSSKTRVTWMREGMRVNRLDREDVDVYLLDRRAMQAIPEALGRPQPRRWSLGWLLADPGLALVIVLALVAFFVIPEFHWSPWVNAVPMMACLALAGWAGKAYPNRAVRWLTAPLRVFVIVTVYLFVLGAAILGVTVRNAGKTARF